MSATGAKRTYEAITDNCTYRFDERGMCIEVIPCTSNTELHVGPRLQVGAHVVPDDHLTSVRASKSGPTLCQTTIRGTRVARHNPRYRGLRCLREVALV